MADMIIVEPFGLFANVGGALGPPMGSLPNDGRAAYFATTSGGGGIGLGNLMTDDPREVWQSPATVVSVSIFIDLGVLRFWDSLALVNGNIPASATWTVSDGVAAYTTNALATAAARLPSDDESTSTGPSFFLSAVPRNTRYIQAVATWATPTLISIGRLVVGKSWKPSLPREIGAGRPPLDTGSRTRLESGGLAVVDGNFTSGFKWTFGDLDSADLAKLWGIMRRVKTTSPILLIEDPDTPFAEELHYGTLVALEPYERSDVSKSRWSLQIEDWV
jgi:hypothetical protein